MLFFEIVIVIDFKNFESKSYVRILLFWFRLCVVSSLMRVCVFLWCVDEFMKIWVWRCRSLGEMLLDI